jgi:regulator of sigma E protease
MALLSLSLAIINVFPLPALDGGKLFFIIAEIIIGRRINQKFESMIHALGFILLMLLILFITYSDIAKLFV